MIQLLGLTRPQHSRLDDLAGTISSGEKSSGGRFTGGTRFAEAFSRSGSDGGTHAIHFLGAGDTVSTFGMFWNLETLPHTANNDAIAHVRHAVAIDERRALFPANLFHPRCLGQHASFKERWFAGTHGDVGGGWPEHDSQLAKITFAWMLDEAAALGCRFGADTTPGGCRLTDTPEALNEEHTDADIPDDRRDDARGEADDRRLPARAQGAERGNPTADARPHAADRLAEHPSVRRRRAGGTRPRGDVLSRAGDRHVRPRHHPRGESDLRQLDELVTTLGGWWRDLVSDVCTGDGGNSERMAFVYDSRKLSFGGLAGEFESPGSMRGSDKKKAKFKGGIRRRGRPTSPDSGPAGSSSRSVRCMLTTAPAAPTSHGVQDARLTAERLRDRMKRKDRWARNAILLGDFNIFADDDKTVRSLEQQGFASPHMLRGKATNAQGDKPFDRLLFIAPDVSFQLKNANAAVFPVFDHVYRDGEHAEYGKTAKAFSQWRTYRMSDHNPVWCEIDIDFTEPYLESRRGKKPETPPTR
jgi:hypothetical protein